MELINIKEGADIEFTDEDILKILTEFMDKTDRYFKENIGMSADLNLERAIDYGSYPAEDILTIAFRKAISIETADKVILLWKDYDMSNCFYGHPILASLEALSFDGMYERILNIINERKAQEEKAIINELITAPVESKEKKRI